MAPNKKQNDRPYDGLAYGLTGAASGTMGKILGNTVSDSFIQRMNRADYLNQNRSRFAGADPRLNLTYIKGGLPGVQMIAEDVFAKHLGIGTDYAPADLSKSGQFAKLLKQRGLESILTVTPEPNSQRFSSADVGGAGGGTTGTVWGNARKPQYTYAAGNLGVKEVFGSNPAAQFSGVDLPKADQRPFLTTGEALHVPESQRGWGVRSQLAGRLGIDGGGDIHFGKEYRQMGGLTTANDIYTYLKSQGIEPPAMTSNQGLNLQELTKKLKEVTGSKSEYAALEQLASPTPRFGPSTRELGSLPVLERLEVKGASDAARTKAGAGSYFDFTSDHPNLVPGVGDSFDFADMIETDTPKNQNIVVRKDFKAANAKTRPIYYGGERGVGNHLAGGFSRFAPGLLGTLITSPQTVDQLKKGDYLGAGATTAGAFGAGEAVSSALNRATLYATNRGVTAAPAIAAGIGRVANPVGAIALASEAEKSQRSPDASEWRERDDSQARTVRQQTPSQAGLAGPDLPHAGLPVSEQERIRTLPDTTRRVKTLPSGNQAAYNINNERKYVGNSLSKGVIPYLNIKFR